MLLIARVTFNHAALVRPPDPGRLAPLQLFEHLETAAATRILAQFKPGMCMRVTADQVLAGCDAEVCLDSRGFRLVFV